MYTIDQIILIADKSMVLGSGEVIFHREWHGKRVFTTNSEPANDMGTAISYGRLYFDNHNQPLVVPHVWNDEDAQLAKGVIWPLVTRDLTH